MPSLDTYHPGPEINTLSVELLYNDLPLIASKDLSHNLTTLRTEVKHFMTTLQKYVRPDILPEALLQKLQASFRMISVLILRL